VELPKRFVDAQTDFVKQAVDHYRESLQKLGDLATKATQHAQSAVKETQAAGERVARQSSRNSKTWAGAMVRAATKSTVKLR
jgi:prefoldin subunit 5